MVFRSSRSFIGISSYGNKASYFKLCDINSVVECLPSKQNVRSSNLLCRSSIICNIIIKHITLYKDKQSKTGISANYWKFQFESGFWNVYRLCDYGVNGNISACHADVASSSLASRSIFYYAQVAELVMRGIANPVKPLF